MQKKLFSFFKPAAAPSGSSAPASDEQRAKRRLSQEATGVTPPARGSLSWLAATPTPVTEPGKSEGGV